MNNSKIIEAANILYNSRINLKKIKELPKDCTPQSFEEAYSIQDELTNDVLAFVDALGAESSRGHLAPGGFQADGFARDAFADPGPRVNRGFRGSGAQHPGLNSFKTKGTKGNYSEKCQFETNI